MTDYIRVLTPLADVLLAIERITEWVCIRKTWNWNLSNMSRPVTFWMKLNVCIYFTYYILEYKMSKILKALQQRKSLHLSFYKHCISQTLDNIKKNDTLYFWGNIIWNCDLWFFSKRKWLYIKRIAKQNMRH